MSGTDDVDQRFREIMDAEFGGGPQKESAHPRPAPQGSVRPQPRQRPTGGDDFNLADALDEVTPDEPAEPFVAPEPAPLPRPKGPVAIGSALVGLGLVAVLFDLMGLDVGFRLGGWAIGCLAVGLAVLLFNIPRSPRDPWDDGSRV